MDKLTDEDNELFEHITTSYKLIERIKKLQKYPKIQMKSVLVMIKINNMIEKINDTMLKNIFNDTT